MFLTSFMPFQFGTWSREGAGTLAVWVWMLVLAVYYFYYYQTSHNDYNSVPPGRFGVFRMTSRVMAAAHPGLGGRLDPWSPFPGSGHGRSSWHSSATADSPTHGALTHPMSQVMSSLHLTEADLCPPQILMLKS